MESVAENRSVAGAHDAPVEPWSPKLVLDLALGIATPDELQEAYGVDSQTWQIWFKHPLFIRQVAEQRQDLKRNGLTFKARARAIAEALLAQLYVIGLDADQPAQVRLKAIEMSVRYAGYEVQPAKDEVTGQQTLQPVLKIELISPKDVTDIKGELVSH